MTKLMKRNLIDADKPTCRVVSAATEFRGKQGHFLAPGISAQSVGSRGIHLQIARLPPGERSKVHKHEHHETAIHVLTGDQGCGSASDLNNISSLELATFFTSPPMCLICPTT